MSYVARGDSHEILFIQPSAGYDLIHAGLAKSGQKVITPFRGNALFARFARELFVRYRIPGRKLWFNKEAITKAEIIVVFDPTITVDYLSWLRRENPEAWMVLIYINKVPDRLEPSAVSSYCEAWSSDIQDCKAYSCLKHCPSFYFDDWKIPKTAPKWDLLYIGRDKGRVPGLLRLKEEVAKLGLVLHARISPDHRYELYKEKYYQKPIPYEEALQLCGMTRAILSFSQGAQVGITIRVFESLFNEIKLVTDDKTLASYDFYHPENIFILGVDDLKRLPAFLSETYVPVDDSILDRYRFSRWLEKLRSSYGSNS